MNKLLKPLILMWILVLLLIAVQASNTNSLNENKEAITNKDSGKMKMETNKDEEKEKEFLSFLKRKKYIYKMNWAAAKESFDEYLADFPGGQYRDEALYWLSYSLSKLSREQKDPYKIIELKEKAIKKLDLLDREYPNSSWQDDARVLRIEISGELVLMGKDDYKKYIDESRNVKDSDLKMFALDTLMKIDSEIAVPTLKKIIKTEKDPQLRKKSVYILGKYDNIDTIEILKETTEKDESKEVRNEARFWLNQINKKMSPVKLDYYIFSARLTDPLELNRFPENKPISFLLDKNEGLFSFFTSIFKNRLKEKISRLFHHKLTWLNKSAQVKGITEFENNIVNAHIFNGFWIQVPPDKIKKDPDRVKGKVLFQNLAQGKKYFAPFSLDSGKDLLIGMRKEDRVSLVVLRAYLGEPTPVYSAKPKPIPKISPNDVDLLTKYTLSSTDFSKIGKGEGYHIYTDKHTWNINIEEDRIIYGKAKADIESARGKWHVSGYLVLLKKSRMIIANNAELINPEGKTAAKGEKITIPLDNPEQYQVSGKKEIKKE